jgi:xylulokinase
MLAVDLGTGGPKTGAVSLSGELLAHARSAVHTRYLPGGGAVQEPDEWWTQVVAGVRDVVGSPRVDPTALVGVGITGQWGSTVPVDGSGQAIAGCRLWADTRGGRFAAKAVGGAVSLFGYSPANILRWVQLTGGAPSPSGADPLGHELYMRNCEPELYARTKTFLEPVDYLGLRFTGRALATPASMVLSWLTDNRPGAKPAYLPELIRRSGRDASRLPDLVATGSVIGNVLPEVAGELGIAEVPVVAGVPDLHSSWVGSGAVAPYQPHVTISTTAWIACEVPFKKTDVLHQMASVPGLRSGRYLIANNHETAGLCLNWLRDSVVDGGYDELTALAADVPAGCDGLMFTPWLNGERTPVEDRTLRGAFLNVSLATGRAQMVRAVLEGVAFNARWLLDAVEKFAGRSFSSLRILGGGAQSDLWCQIHADILGKTIERVEEPMHATVRGAGLFAAMSLGKLSLEDVPQLARVAATFEPNQQARSTYEPMYREFKGFYGALHGSYARLNRGLATQ